MSASWISRVRFDVMMTIGGCSALTVPSSGIVTWKSESTSSRKASKASSVRSSSSIRRTGAPGRVGLERLQERPLHQVAFREQVALQRVAVDRCRRPPPGGSPSSAPA